MGIRFHQEIKNTTTELNMKVSFCLLIALAVLLSVLLPEVDAKPRQRSRGRGADEAMEVEEATPEARRRARARKSRARKGRKSGAAKRRKQEKRRPSQKRFRAARRG